MAGFAIVMTVLMVSFFAFVAACVLSLCLYLLAKRRMRLREETSRNLTVVCALAPFLGLLWLVAALLIHVQISNNLAHQDCGFSSDPYVTLPNGYILGSHNTYDGYIVAPGFKTDVPIAGPGYVRSIIDLHYSNGYFTGSQFDLKTATVRHFTFDTRTRSYETFDPTSSSPKHFDSSDPSDLAAWTASETEANNAENPDSYWRLYERYRHNWPNYVLLVMIIGGEGAIAFWVWRLWVEPNRIADSRSLSLLN